MVAHGSVVDKDGLDGGDLLQIGRHEMFVRVHVGVVRARLVVRVVLDELKAGKADAVEGKAGTYCTKPRTSPSNK